MVYILTSNGNIINVDVRPQESRTGDAASSAKLSLTLKPKLSKDVFEEQQGYIDIAATAAYVSLNRLDQENRFRSSINYISENEKELNFIKGSSSSGLGNALALFKTYWTEVLRKSSGYEFPVFATGEVNRNGGILGIGHLEKKIQSVLGFVTKKHIQNFYVCIPKANREQLSPELIESVRKKGGQLVAKDKLQEMLLALLGNQYDGDPLGRWEPFKGLDSFEYRDSIRFFGRKNEIERIYADLNSNSNIVIVSGPTGCGKSSLIKAGLIPYLKQKNSCDHWITLTPNHLKKSRLLREVIDLFALTTGNLSEEKKDEVEKSLLDNKKHAVLHVFNELKVLNHTFLLHIDQFEELFTSAYSEQILKDLRIIIELLKLTNDIKIVISIRNEYLHNLLETGLIKSPVISNVSSVLSPESWAELVSQQAAISDIFYEKNDEKSLDQLIIDEAVKTPSALPLVQFVLKQLYDQAQKQQVNKTTLRIEHYENMGGLSGAVAHRAEQAIKESEISDEIIKNFFSLFVSTNSEGVTYSKLVEWPAGKFSIELTELVSNLHNANILTREKNKQGISTYRFTHTALFTSWPRLASWTKTQSEFLAWKNSIDRSFQSWRFVKENYKVDFVIRDKKLIKEGLGYLKRGLIIDWELSEYLIFSQKRGHLKFVFVSIFTAFLVISVATTVPSFVYKAAEVEINTLTCKTADSSGKLTDILEISVLNESQAEKLEKKLCHGNSAEIAQHYGQVKFFWNSLEDSYDLEKLFSGKLAVVQSSESSLIASNIISNPALYTPIAKNPDYYACIYSRKSVSMPVELRGDFFQGKTIGFSNKVYSQSGYQVPYLEIVEMGVFPNIKKYASRIAMMADLKEGKIDFAGSYCPYGKQDEDIVSQDFNFKKIEKPIVGITWYVSKKNRVKGLKNEVQKYLRNSAMTASSEYFRNLEILKIEGYQGE